MESDSEEPLAREMAYYLAHQGELRDRYPDSFVAILGEEVLHHAPTLPELAKYVYAKYGRREILMTHVDWGQREVRIPSFRIVR
jgi:hypothetical protein